MKEIPELSVGDKVEWTSQASGYVRTKSGTVREVVPAGVMPTLGGRRILRGRSHIPRQTKSYVVQSAGKWYWPLAHYLKKIGPPK